MSETLTFKRKFNSTKDCVPGALNANRTFGTADVKKWLIATHAWETGWQELVFYSASDAAEFAKSRDAELLGFEDGSTQ